ncbi:MAG: hypothetical protein Q7N87_02140 [Candidatus Uhrbacteria bacterium]|nr:hypothetical protein [Candidatus Uhrbacteria bacterium]
MKKILKSKTVHVGAAFGVLAVVGVMLFQGSIPSDARQVKFNTISPNQGVVGTEVVISGSGFTVSVQGIVGTKVNDKVYAPGNYVLVKDELINQPLISPDGKTLTVNLDLVSAAAKRECDQKFSKKNPQPCKVPVKVINAYGKPSNAVEFTFIGREDNKLTYTITVTQAPNGTITPGTTSVTSGSSQIFTLTAATGYQVAGVIVDGVDWGGSNLPQQTFILNDITSAYSLTARFSPVSITQSCSLTVSIAPTTPPAQNISPGQSGVNLVKFNATSNCDGTLKSFAVSLLPMLTNYQNISTLRLYDDVSGVQLGTTQSVTTAGMNFPSINTPLTANQVRVFRVVGDVSPSAIIGSTVYGVFGGSSGVTDVIGSNGVIGNNASGNLISGNTMTIR